MGSNGPAEVMPALSHGWWKGWRGPKPLTADFRDRGRGFNVLSVSVIGRSDSTSYRLSVIGYRLSVYRLEAELHPRFFHSALRARIGSFL
jgi:hypothetical protein